MRTTSKTEEPFREKSGSISKRLFCVHLTAKWFSFCDFGTDRTIVIDFPDPDCISVGQIVDNLDDDYLMKLNDATDKYKISVQVFDLPKKTEYGIDALKTLAAKGVQKAIALHHRCLTKSNKEITHQSAELNSASFIASSDMILKTDVNTADTSTKLASFSHPTASSSSSTTVSEHLTYIDGQNITFESGFEECLSNVLAIFSALVNLTDHILSTVLNQSEINKCRLGLAYLILSLQRQLQQPEIAALEIEALRTAGTEKPVGSSRTQDGRITGAFTACPSKKWLPLLVQKAQEILKDNELPGPLVISSTMPWKYRARKSSSSNSAEEDDVLSLYRKGCARMIPLIDRIKFVLENKMYLPYFYVKCNQEIRRDAKEQDPVVKPCRMKFYQKKELLKHIRMVHRKSEKEADLPPYKFLSCSLCSDNGIDATFSFLI